VALPLRPIAPIGDPTNPLYYQELDFLGLETGWAAEPADFTGWNELTRFSRDAYDLLTFEHFANGVHNALKIAKFVLYASYEPNGNVYKINKNLSYAQDANGVWSHAVGNEATLTRVGAGNVTVDILYNMPNALYRLFDATPYYIKPLQGFDTAVVSNYARCWIVAITDANTFRIKRKTWASFGGAGVTDGVDGDFCILIHGAP
jgi:hypothetical protein